MSIRKKEEMWLSLSERILNERPERLQELLLEISKKHPEMSFYATDLARLRMAGGEKAEELRRLCRSRSVDRIEAIAGRGRDPGCRALAFLAGLLRTSLAGGDGERNSGRGVSH